MSNQVGEHFKGFHTVHFVHVECPLQFRPDVLNRVQSKDRDFQVIPRRHKSLYACFFCLFFKQNMVMDDKENYTCELRHMEFRTEFLFIQNNFRDASNWHSVKKKVLNKHTS